MFIDTHAHLYAEEFDADRDAVVERALAAGVTRLVLPDIDRATREAEFALAERYPGVMIPLLGIHPTSVNREYQEEVAAFEKELGKRTVYGIGECGIDLYWDKTYYKEQVTVFERQLHVAREMDLPVIIHSRKSLQEIFAIFKRQHYNMKGVFHCFPGNEEDARRVIDHGFLLGIGGVVTFQNASLAEVIKKTGVERVVLETDAPYLAPVPHRGKRNESSYIPLIAARLAELLDMDVKKIAETTTNNALNLFSLQV